MTMDEITKLATELERHAQADVRTGCSPEDRHPARIAARAALLRAVEDLELEAAKAGSWRQAAEGFRRERDDLAGRFATETKERDRCRDGWANERARAEAAEKERDLYRRQVEVRYGKAEEQIERLTLERDAANATAQRIAERLTAAESALAAMRETMEVGGAIVAWVEQELRAEDTEGTAACPGYPDTRKVRPLIDRWRVLASPPPAAMSTETDAVVACTCLETLVHHQPRCPNYGRTDGWRPTPTKSKEDTHHG